MSAQWAEVIGYEDRYSISDQGQVRTIPKPKMARDWEDSAYLRLSPPARKPEDLPRIGHDVRVLYLEDVATVLLWRPFTSMRYSVAELVALAFIGPRPLRARLVHLNGSRLGISVENLHWEENAPRRGRIEVVTPQLVGGRLPKGTPENRVLAPHVEKAIQQALLKNQHTEAMLCRAFKISAGQLVSIRKGVSSDRN